MKKILAIVMVSISSVCGYAQDWNRELSMQAQLTKTPEATMLDRFQNYPVSNCVGIPDISIPVYTIEAGDLKLPISLSYHLGGNKVNDIATWVGLGWNLNVGGMISREIKGINDEDKSSGFLNSPELSLRTRTGGSIKVKVPIKEKEFNSLNDYDLDGFGNIEWYFKELISETYDMGSDIYSYSINGLSGSFVYDMDRNLVNIPYSNNRIDRDQINNSFKITDPGGIIYTFSDKEDIYIPTKRAKRGLTAASNWKVSTIVSPGSSNSIKFTYSDPAVYKVFNRSGTLSVGYNADGSGSQTNERDLNGSYTEFYERNLTRIDFDNGSIDFILTSTQRKDKGGHYSLSAIVVKDKQGAVIKRIGFNYSYFQSSTNPAKDTDYRLKLESIEIRGNDGGSPLRYTFHYNETPSLPPRWSDKGSSVSLGQDFWGYYNGVTSNAHLVGKISRTDREAYTFLNNNLANRNPSEHHMKAWTLKKINYPTGGFSEFFTEANKDKDNKIAGGLRLAKIISKPDTGSTPVTTLYKYENPLYIKLINDNEDYDLYKYRIFIGLRGSGTNQFTNHCRYYYTEEPFSGLFFHQGSPIIYRKVIKTEEGQGKTEYTYSAPYVYRQVITANPAIGQTFATPRYPYIENLQSWVMGKLEREDFYKEGESKPVKSINYIYTVGHKKRITIGKHASERYIFNYDPPRPLASASALFDYFWEEYETGFYKLEGTEEIKDGVSLKTDYTYGKVDLAKTNNIQLTKRQEIIHDRIIGHEYKYAQDFTDAVSKEMVARNMINVSLEHTTKSGNTHISTQKRNFAKFGSFYKSASEQSKTGNGTFNTDLTYNVYDTKGNIQQLTTKDSISTVYLWSYGGQYPIAEIKNATYAQVRDILGGQTIVDNIAKSIVLSDTDKAKVNSLRTSLSGAHVTTYTYKPLVGMLSATDPAGITTCYEYDSFNRLKRTYIKEGTTEKNIRTYDYHYQNQ
ncbi:MAG: hypothetical protein LBV71_19100 [Prevotella sp.]|jgi:hypothetical protein|nr:hypothetical protein [Prevotella sp.]